MVWNIMWRLSMIPSTPLAKVIVRYTTSTFKALAAPITPASNAASSPLDDVSLAQLLYISGI
jgi:hypothetical protein